MPERVLRAVVVGMKGDEIPVMSALHALSCVQIIDCGEDDGFSRGRPPERISTLSEKVLMLRTLISELELEDQGIPPQPRSEILKNMDKRLTSIRNEILSRLKEKKNLENELNALTRKREEYAPFHALGVDISAYRGYRTLHVFVGRVSNDISAEVMRVSRRGSSWSARSEDGFYICAFVPKEDAERIGNILSQNGFQEIPIPEGGGDPSKILADLDGKIADLSDRVLRVEREIIRLRERYCRDILALEELLTEEVEKLETPLRICASKTTFIADLWVPEKAYPRVKETVERSSEGRAICLKIKKRKNEDEPVIMKNPRILSPFEAMVRLFSPPKYEEIDPTVMVSIFFPIFFGVMVSDVGFGIVLTILGILFLRGRTLGLEGIVSRDGLKQMGGILFYGGIAGTLLGLLIFGEMFGVPFTPAHEGELAWGIPLLIPGAHIEKFQNIGDLLALSIMFAGAHLALGLCLGIVNKYRHEKRHAAGKIGWLMVLIGVVSAILIFASGMGNRLSRVTVSCILYPLGIMTFPLGSVSFPTIPVILVLLGLPVAVAGEGGIALLELFTMVSNIFSYARIAAIGVAEAGIHLGFNMMILPTIISGSHELTPLSIALIVGSVFLLIMAHMLVFILGSISAGIQSLRLHFFEFFTKFYEGGGTEFTPFGRRLKYLKEV